MYTPGTLHRHRDRRVASPPERGTSGKAVPSVSTILNRVRYIEPRPISAIYGNCAGIYERGVEIYEHGAQTHAER